MKPPPKPPALPWQPESHEAIKARLTKAMSRIFNVREITNGKGPLPYADRAYVFDFEEGVRMIVSVIQDGTEKPVLQTSYGLPPHSTFVPGQLPVLAAVLAAEMFGLRKIVDVVMTARALYLFYDYEGTSHN